MLSVVRGMAALGLGSRTQSFHTTPILASVFMKKQKKMDPEVAKQRENRRRKRLEKEIRSMQKHSKKPKPVDEMSLDVRSSRNLNERHRPPVTYTEEQEDEWALAYKDYTRSRNEAQLADDEWIRVAVRRQEKALRVLKDLDPVLYEKAIQPDSHLLPLKSEGPSLSPPVAGYTAPDGDYVDTTRTWS